ncbi:MAG TPA: glycosyltransferase [Candidatus Hydrogenedentes bacterium]|nr:glycosyltransferase [Candidatus Hydrogenedentota bacterium]
MGISIAMIVKNEAGFLAECLEGLQDLAEEFCVVDTGSSDETVTIAESFGCRMGHYVWNNDFAAARNESLKMCRGDWIFVVDADERIAGEDIPCLCALIEHGPQYCYRFVTRNYTNNARVSEFTPCLPEDPMARGFAGWFPSGKVRLFPNHFGAYFEGQVHELVNPSLLARGIEIVTSDIPIHHYPLLKPEEQVRKKQLMYIELGLAKLREDPKNARLAAELGNQYAEINDYVNAVVMYREAVRSEPNNPLYLKDLGGVMHLLGKNEEAIKAFTLALRLDAAMADAWRNLGVVYASQQQWVEALECFDHFTGLAAGDSEAHRYRAVALERLGRLPEALVEAREALRLHPANQEAHSLERQLSEKLGAMPPE